MMSNEDKMMQESILYSMGLETQISRKFHAMSKKPADKWTLKTSGSIRIAEAAGLFSLW